MTQSKKLRQDNDSNKKESLEQTNNSLTSDEKQASAHKSNHPSDIAISKFKYDQAKIANIIAAIAVTVSIFLAIFTYSLFKQTSTQTKAANKAAAASVTADSIANNNYNLSDSIYKVTDTANKRTLSETKRYDDNFLAAQEKAFNENKKDADVRELRDKKSFEESKKQFEIENRPFLQLVNIRVDTITHGKPITITYYFYNYGRFPAKVISVNTQVEYGITNDYPASKEVESPYNTKTNFYIANGISQQLSCVGRDTLPKNFVDSYNSGKISLFMYGYCEFINPITSKKFLYKFKNRINTKPFFTEDAQRNEVIEEK